MRRTIIEQEVEGKNRPTRVHRVLVEMRERILRGKVGPDSNLPPETLLATEFGVSRVVVREAMQTLRAEGLIEGSQGRRARVRPVDPKMVANTLGMFLQRSEGTLLHLLEARRPLETEIVALAADRWEDRHLLDAQKAIDDMEVAPSLDAAVEADVRFHQVLAEATGNPVFPLLLLALGELLKESRRRTLRSETLLAANAHHRAIFAAVQARDPTRARLEMLKHLEIAREDLRKNPA